jgi:protein-serine/threonine kinase
MFESFFKFGGASRSARRETLNNNLKKAGTEAEKKQIKKEWLMQGSHSLRMLREKMTIDKFEMLQTLGHGGFGVVRLVRFKVTGEIFAMKLLKKEVMLKMRQESHVRMERDLLSQASEVSEWIVRLVCTFQDQDFLYFVLEYMPGGDLLGLLIKLDIFKEDMARHYCAEMVCAIEEVHKLG